VLALCDGPLARSADLARADPAGRLVYDKAYDDAAVRLSRGIAQTYADPAGHTQFTVTEMLPDLDQLWLTDREGRRYSSELRIIAYDSMR
jgi:hypothetical protein